MEPKLPAPSIDINGLMDNTKKDRIIRFSEHIPFREDMEIFYDAYHKKYQLELLSNGGFYTPVTRVKIADSIRLYDQIHIWKPYPILYQREDETILYLYVRGNRIPLMNSDLITDIIDKLNLGDVFHVEALAKTLLEQADESVVSYLLTILLEFKAIKRIQ